MKEQIDLTIKPTMRCNMQCKHCFNGDAFSHKDMLQVDQACIFMEKACQEYRKVKVIFHGGEPTLAGIGFYKDFFQYQQTLVNKYRTEFKNVITTNGLLLSEELVDLFNANNVQINISYDGPFNSVLRQYSDRVLNNILMVRDKGSKFRCFCTLSKESVCHLEEIYDWFKQNRLHFKTLPIEKRGYAKENGDIVMSPEILASQFAIMYEKWSKDKDCHISYSTMEELSTLRRTAPYKKYWFGRKIALNPDGLMYTFGRPNDVRYCLGRPSEAANLSDCFNTEEYKKCLNEMEKMRAVRCPNCSSKITCGGVNINIAYLYVEEMDLIDYSCKQAALIDEYILKINDVIIEDFKNGLSKNYNEYIQGQFSEYIK